MAHKNVGRSKGEAVRPHDIYACYNCPEDVWPYCHYRKRAKYMSRLDQWIRCPRLRICTVGGESVKQIAAIIDEIEPK